MKTNYLRMLALCLFLFLLPALSAAVEVAPRISDLEIIKSLAEIKARFDTIDQRFDDQNKGIDQRFDAIDQRFDAIDQRFDDQNKSIDQRFDAIDRRFDAINQRFDDQNKSIDQRFDAIDNRFADQGKQINGIQNTMLALFGAIVSLIIAMFAYIAWDRRTMMQPMRERIETLEHSIHRDLDLDHADGSRLKRLLAALQELAKTDAKLETVLRNFSLL